jgi:hypothetical protein
MRKTLTLSLTLMTLFLAGNSLAGKSGQDILSKWEEKGNTEMIPKCIPLPRWVHEQFVTIGRWQFQVITYNVSGGTEPELRVYYRLTAPVKEESGRQIIFTVAKPYRVESLSSLGIQRVIKYCDRDQETDEATMIERYNRSTGEFEQNFYQ